ncbi:MAG TPA: hypothetical protein VGH97_00925 [Thermoanaerobaculia bacterium]|jgi:hypothetical protein
MEALGRLARRLALPALALTLATASSAETSLEAAAGLHPMTRVFSIDRRLPRAMRPVLEEAARKLSDSRCQEILEDFSDSSGRPLERNLAATGQAMPGYLEWVLFYDGQASAPCADHAVLAWTNPGSRAVHVCGDQFAAIARGHTGDAANILIHEALHTLGLGEGPPDAREITARVQSRCGR